MKKSLALKLLEDHLLAGELKTGQEIAIKIDQTLTQDSTGTMVYLQLEAMDPDKIETELSVAYVDHNTLQSDYKNPDDHRFIQSAAEKYGLVFSKPGAGICHQVHLEQFAKPGKSLLGSDSHTPTGGGLGALAIGAGGLDVAVAIARGYYYLKVPKVYQVYLTGSLGPHVNAKDVILTILRKLGVKGGLGYIMEYTGPGLKSLSVPQRATICNMGAELGATSSLFPSDERTQDFLRRQGREEDFRPLAADPDASYDQTLELDLSEIKPALACPHSPDAVKNVEEVGRIPVNQVAIGSCTNSSYTDMMAVVKILEGRQVHPDVSLVISPGSATILRLLSENGGLATMIGAGARILESACGPCIGMGQAPSSGAVSLRSFNRNFKGRSGTLDADIYLASPQTCAASAVLGYIGDPSELPPPGAQEEPENYGPVKSYFIYPTDPENRPKATLKGPNIKPFPKTRPLPSTLKGRVLFKGGDHITTDDICPSNASLLPYRSNIPYLSQFAFKTLIPDFKERAEASPGGLIVAGDNYGQGSSREHAALVPLQLGVQAVIALSFARIHRQNLINSGILPLVFENPEDYKSINEGDLLEIKDLRDQLGRGLVLRNLSQNKDIALSLPLSDREKKVLLQGGYLNYAKTHVPGGKEN
ncbi:MAG: aconitate hydratase [Tissierellia bacterium]|nr:aconitate hydratase [Tissierellia bacterium]